jgi:glycosyltransferase involved in cell wall biosynthesis
MTLVTVGIPTYNAMPYLTKAVESILQQTMSDLRLHVVDDGSTDDTWEYLQSIDDKRLTAVRQENKGVGETSNRLLQMCETKYFARMDADDVAHPDRIAKQVQFMEDHLEVGVCGTQVHYLVGDKTIPALHFPTGHSAIQSAFKAMRFPLCNPTLIWRMELVARVGGYRVKRYGEDLDFVIRCCELAEARNLTEVLLHQRLTEGSGSFLAARLQSTSARWALYCADKRKRREHEPSFEEFLGLHEARGYFEKFIDSLESAGATQYRLSLIDRAMGRQLRGFLRLAMAAGLRPRAVLSRVAEVLRPSSH